MKTGWSIRWITSGLAGITFPIYVGTLTMFASKEGAHLWDSKEAAEDFANNQNYNKNVFEVVLLTK